MHKIVWCKKAIQVKSCWRRFTLLELLIVIAIIMMLMSIMLPALSRVRTKASQLTCKNNLKQLSLGISCYSNDNSDYIIPNNIDSRWWSPSVPSASVWTNGAWNQHLWWDGYIQAAKAYWCPSDTKYPLSGYTSADKFKPLDQKLSYGLAGTGPYEDCSMIKMSCIQRPAVSLSLVDSHRENMWIASNNSCTEPSYLFTSAHLNGVLAAPDADTNFVHELKMNMALLDGHVESLRPVGTPWLDWVGKYEETVSLSWMVTAFGNSGYPKPAGYR